MDELIDGIREAIQGIDLSGQINEDALVKTVAYFENDGLTIDILEEGDERICPSDLIIYTVYDVYKYEALRA